MIDSLLGWFVIAIPFLVTVGAIVLALRLPNERHYRKFVGAAIVLGIVFSGLTYWQQIRAAKQAARDRDIAINETSERVAKETTANITKAIGDQYKEIIDSLTSQVGALKGQLAAQGKKVDAIGESNIVTGKKPVHVIVENQHLPVPAGEVPLDVHASEMPVQPRSELGKHAMQYILTTNKVMNGARAIFTCKGIINNGSASISGAGTTLGGGGRVDEHTFNSGIEAPNWSPDFPLVVTLYYDGDTIDPCKITLPR